MPLDKSISKQIAEKKEKEKEEIEEGVGDVEEEEIFVDEKRLQNLKVGESVSVNGINCNVLRVTERKLTLRLGK